MAKHERCGVGGTVPPVAGRWPKGVSGNPLGRRSNAALLHEALLARISVDEIAELIAEQLRAGDSRVLLAVVDRWWPKPPASIELSGPDGGPVYVEGARERLIERLRRRDAA